MERGVRPCECRKARALAALIERIPERYRASVFATYHPKTAAEQETHVTMTSQPGGSYFIYGPYDHGKTHLAYAQYRHLAESGVRVMFFSMAQLLSELRRSEMDDEYFCTVRERVRSGEPFHLFVDDIDKFKVTDFKFEALFDLIDTAWTRKHGITVTSNFSLRELVELEKLHPAIVRRLDDVCKAVMV